ncbi:MAG: c-type cytochrome [Magnetovibrio sp.]|nr:c-type cytochrome [Magnetovibrio sp.]
MRTLLLLTGLAVTAMAAPGLAHGPGGKPSAAFQAYEAGKIPAKFKKRKNPLKSSKGAAAAGMKLYQENCVMCHGAEARGKGHMAAEMEVKPADLRMMLRHFPDLDDYYLWMISEGGGAFELPMPGYGEALSERQIWQIISWMQAGFPGAGTDVKDVMHHGQHKPGGHMGGTHMPGMPGHGMKRRKSN